MNIPISTKELLPPNNTYVLAFFPESPWGDRDAANNEHKWVVVKFIQGISEKERTDMEAGIITNPNYNGGKRSKFYCSEDEHGNNAKPYYWKPFGPGKFFGQEATLWMHLPSGVTQ